jgi:hypothetical protein
VWQTTSTPPKIEVQQIDPSKIEDIRRRWAEKEKSLLLDKNKDLPGEKEPPADARYLSDKNRRVEKEQRAKNTDVLPNPETTPEQKQKAPLAKFGLPLNINKQAAPPKIAADQATLERMLPEGGENLLNTQESVFYSFYARLYEAVAPIWQSRVRAVQYQRQIKPGDYTTVIDAVFNKDGELVEVRFLKNSGILDFDNAAEMCWRKIGRFPNPPKGLLDESGLIHTGWTFTVNVSAGA